MSEPRRLLVDLLDYADGRDGRRLDRTGHNDELVNGWALTPRGKTLLAENERLRAALERVASDWHEKTHWRSNRVAFPNCRIGHCGEARAALEGTTE